MSIDPIGFLPASQAVRMSSSFPAQAPGTDDVAAPGAHGFVDWLSAQAATTSGQLVRAEEGLQALASGENVSLHHVMIGLEEARLSFQLMAQVRNRLVESYQEVMRMQI